MNYIECSYEESCSIRNFLKSCGKDFNDTEVVSKVYLPGSDDLSIVLEIKDLETEDARDILISRNFLLDKMRDMKWV